MGWNNLASTDSYQDSLILKAERETRQEIILCAIFLSIALRRCPSEAINAQVKAGSRYSQEATKRLYLVNYRLNLQEYTRSWLSSLVVDENGKQTESF